MNTAIKNLARKNTLPQYIAIDLKSFYASVECRKRNLDPLTTNLVVADKSRTEKTICLAVSPSLKKLGLSGRARLFEVVQKVKEANCLRRYKNKIKAFTGSSSDAIELAEKPQLAIDYIVAVPHMAEYIDVSAQIYGIYLDFIAPEDIHVYSIDEVIMDVTPYLATYHMTAAQLASRIIVQIREETGITATAGVGTNMYLAKIAMDIIAKHIPPDENGIPVATLDEMSYRQLLWAHQPLTDFWRIGRGYARQLADHGMYTMGDIARCSLGLEGRYYNEDLLYKLFGVNAELLIDHAWGWEPCTIKDIKSYQPDNRSTCSGQVLQKATSAADARVIAWEMADNLALDLFSKKLVTDQLVLHVGYDAESLNTPAGKKYTGEITTNHFGKLVPKSAHGSINLGKFTASAQDITKALRELFDQIVNPDLLVRRLSLAANHIIPATEAKTQPQQLSLFTEEELNPQLCSEPNLNKNYSTNAEKEQHIQEAILSIKKRYGKNALLKGANLQECATTIQRNAQIGGHRA